jgi:2-hydroxy-3-keto-5-methylthiopentenyl-1-phosphate phosphatase
MNLVIMVDFDGTMVTIDTSEYLLDAFAPKDWRVIDEQLEKGEVTFKESLEREFAMLKVPERAMIDALEPVTRFRPNFHQVVEYCRGNHFPIIVVSGGLDFCIRHFLRLKGWLDLVEIYAPKAKCTDDGVTLTFPELLDQSSSNFKDDLVRSHKRNGERVVYIGNGLGDFPAAQISDLAFAIEGSRLAELCRIRGLACEEFTDFKQVVDSITGSASSTSR